MARVKLKNAPADNGPPAAAPKEEAVPIQVKIMEAEAALNTALVEREDEVRLAMIALFAQEHLFLLGPPGVGKSLLLDSMMRWMDASKFDILMTKFTTPEEICGPVSVPALKREEFYRVTKNMMPEAHIMFCDEIWKASSAILNTMLTLLNERHYKNGTKGRLKCPLKLCVAASNEAPNEANGGQELGALWDRFLLRKTVRPVTDNGMRRMLRKAVSCDSFRAEFPHTITPDEVDQGHQEAMRLPWSDAAKKALWDIRCELIKAGVKPGDRRTLKSINIARASAYVSGADEVQPEHLEVLRHVLWDDMGEQADKCTKVVLRFANPVGARVNDLLLQAQEVSDKGAAQLREGGRDAEGVISEVKTKLEDMQRELAVLEKTPRQRQAAEYVAGEIKNWLARARPGHREEE